ncbi:MAG: hypothetical protein N2558_00445 [Patescibacteria group bacterium]|nr:hypothetical protein [Patescibacteria group bacterium]
MGKIRFLLLLLALAVVYSSFLLPGIRVANDFPDVAEEVLKTGYDMPRIWTGEYNGFGNYAISTMWAWPMNFLYAFGAQIGLPFSLLYRILGFYLFLFLGIYSFSKLLSLYQISKNGKLVATLFYLANTYIVLLIDGGQYLIALAYAFLPFCFFSFIESQKKSFYKKLLAALSITILGYFDIRFVYVLFLLMFFYIFVTIVFSSFEDSLNKLFEFFKTFLVVCFVFVTFNFYWLLPALLVQPPSLPLGYDRLSQVRELSFASLSHGLFVISPHWHKNNFGEIAKINSFFGMIAIFVFLTPIFVRRNKHVAFWFLICLVFVFLVKGSKEPFGSIYEWLFLNIPGFSMFRDPTKFFFLVCLSFAVLLGFSITVLEKKYKLILKVKNISIPFFTSSFLFVWFLLMYPTYTNLMTGTLSKPIYLNEFEKIKKHLLDDQGFGRVLWLPQRPPLGYAALENPSVSAYELIKIRPFATGIIGTYETMNFLRDSSYMDKFLDMAGIKYVAYPFYDIRRKEVSEDERNYYFTFLDQLKNTKWFGNLIYDYPVAFLQTKSNKDLIYLANETVGVVGSDKIYEEIDFLGADLSKNPLLFIEESHNLSSYVKSGDIRKVILYNKNLLDLYLSFIDTGRYVFPSKNLDFSPSQSSWWKRESMDFVWWRSFLQEKYLIDNTDFDYGGGWAIAERESELEIIDQSFKKQGDLYARVLFSKKGGKVSFWQSGKEIGSIQTKVENPREIIRAVKGYGDTKDKELTFYDSNFLWVKVGELISYESITIKTQGDLNVINALVVIEKDELQKIIFSTKDIEINQWENMNLKDKKNLFSQNVSNTATLSYRKLNSTEYLLNVKNLNNRATIVFTNTYDKLWILNSSQSLPVYSFANGFVVSNSGEYKIFYYPNKFVEIGFYVSVFFVTFILIVFISNFLTFKITNKNERK